VHLGDVNDNMVSYQQQFHQHQHQQKEQSHHVSSRFARAIEPSACSAQQYKTPSWQQHSSSNAQQQQQEELCSGSSPADEPTPCPLCLPMSKQQCHIKQDEISCYQGQKQQQQQGGSNWTSEGTAKTQKPKKFSKMLAKCKEGVLRACHIAPAEQRGVAVSRHASSQSMLSG
jgi:hypothetical protein